jgi:hypothetical protein
LTPEEKYEEDLIWLANTVAPDDIYDFSMQCFQAAEYFLSMWSNSTDLTDLYLNDKRARTWIRNIVGFRMMKDGKLDHKLNLDVPNENCD